MEMQSSGRENILSRFNLESLREPRAMAVAAFVAGLAIGLVFLGWYVFPVQWTDASPQQLRADVQEDYLRMALDSYSLHENADVANQRMAELGDAAPDILAAIAADRGDQKKGAINYFQSQVGVVEAGSADDAPVAEQELVAAEEPEEEGALLTSNSLLYTICGFVAVIGVALAAITYMRRQQGGDRSAALKAQDLTRSAQGSNFDALGDAPISQWMTTYLMGDDLFDDSFSIDSTSGEFLGECGVGIAETIGVGDPKRVSAFELWLFDKNDIQTVTKVLMSNHTFRDDSSRERLAAKGEPILAAPGAEAVLETETLQLVVRVVDMEYGDGPLPEESYFDRVTLELAVCSKQ